MGREQSRDLRRHSSSFAYHVTSLWRPPSCFAAMLFCDDTVTRRRCYNVTVPHLHITWPLYGGCHLVLVPFCFAMIRSSGALLRAKVKCFDGSDGSRAVTWFMTSQLFICISRDLFMEAAMLFCCHVVLHWYDYQEALLQRHSSSFAYHVTSLWRLPSCFAAMLFCDDTVTRKRCYNVTVPHLHITWPLYGDCHLILLPCCFDYQTALRGKVEGPRPFVLVQLPVRVRLVALNMSSVVNPITNPVGLVTLMKDQRSPTFCIYTIAI